MSTKYIEQRLVFLLVGALLMVGGVLQENVFELMSLVTGSSIFIVLSILNSSDLASFLMTLRLSQRDEKVRASDYED